MSSPQTDSTRSKKAAKLGQRLGIQFSLTPSAFMMKDVKEAEKLKKKKQAAAAAAQKRRADSDRRMQQKVQKDKDILESFDKMRQKLNHFDALLNAKPTNVFKHRGTISNESRVNSNNTSFTVMDRKSIDAGNNDGDNVVDKIYRETLEEITKQKLDRGIQLGKRNDESDIQDENEDSSNGGLDGSECHVAATSPQKKAFMKLYEIHEPKYLNIKDREYHSYKIRVDFWSPMDIERMRPYHNQAHEYGKHPIFVILSVPDICTPYDLINSILKAWKWSNSHSYRLSCDGKCYEAAAFKKDANCPLLKELRIPLGGLLQIEYDLSHDHWQWYGQVMDVEITTVKRTQIRLLQSSIDVPIQYLSDFKDKYLIKASPPKAPQPLPFNKKSSMKPVPASIGSDIRHLRNPEGDLESIDLSQNRDPSRWNDHDGRYYESSKSKMNRILLSFYKEGLLIDLNDGGTMANNDNEEEGEEGTDARSYQHQARLHANTHGLLYG